MKKAALWAVFIVILCVSLSACVMGGSARQDPEPNDSQSSATSLGTLGEMTINGKLDSSDREDWFSFNNNSHSLVEFEIIELGGLEIDWTFYRGSTQLGSGYSEGYHNYPSQPYSSNYALQIELDSYSDGGDYILLVKCR